MPGVQMIDLEPYKHKLRETYHRLVAERDALEEEATARTVVFEPGDFAAPENHPSDMGTEVFLRGRNEALEDNLDEIIAQCERALQKIEEGTYGFSDLSGEFIGEERLEAVPYATMTVEEQEHIIEG